ncbi:nucleotidyl transferase AbiEii/AbiGii toxin family protein [Candidatus Micrarchaeota archaeon]|nr:nucleotidyl transferase AbiEii/AbiGii toxin family protein [Candidatus Micrarchaeota archaeon]
MINKFHLKYQKILDILGDIAECTDQKLILVGGTALALFHLKHRVSIDLDFVPVDGDDVVLKEELKGKITNKGYKTNRSSFPNQFIIQFEDTSIKVEIFHSDYKIKKIESFTFGTNKLLVASIEDILNMKLETYKDRKKVRDLFDIVFILKDLGRDFKIIDGLLAHGLPEDMDEINSLALDEKDLNFFSEVIRNASKAGN